MIEILKNHETWVAVGVVLFIAVVLWFRVPAMGAKVLDARAATIARELDEAKRLRVEAEALLASYKTKTADAEREAAAILEGAKEEAALMQAEGRTQLEALIQRRTQMAEGKIRQAETDAVAEVKATAAKAAIGAAQAILAQRIDAPKANQIADAAIRDLRTRLN